MLAEANVVRGYKVLPGKRISATALKKRHPHHSFIYQLRMRSDIAKFFFSYRNKWSLTNQ